MLKLNGVFLHSMPHNEEKMLWQKIRTLIVQVKLLTAKQRFLQMVEKLRGSLYPLYTSWSKTSLLLTYLSVCQDFLTFSFKESKSH